LVCGGRSTQTVSIRQGKAALTASARDHSQTLKNCRPGQSIDWCINRAKKRTSTWSWKCRARPAPTRYCCLRVRSAMPCLAEPGAFAPLWPWRTGRLKDITTRELPQEPDAGDLFDRRRAASWKPGLCDPENNHALRALDTKSWADAPAEDSHAVLVSRTQPPQVDGEWHITIEVSATWHCLWRMCILI